MYLILTESAWATLTKSAIGRSRYNEDLRQSAEERMFYTESSRLLFLCCLNLSADSPVFFLSPLQLHRKAIIFITASRSCCQVWTVLCKGSHVSCGSGVVCQTGRQDWVRDVWPQFTKCISPVRRFAWKSLLVVVLMELWMYGGCGTMAFFSF